MVGTADHHGVVVSDIDRALTFYRDTLGMDVVDEISQESDAFSRAVGVENTDVDLAFLDAHGFTIELVEYNRPDGNNANETTTSNDVGATHFCLAVEDIEGVYDDLREDAEFVSTPQELKNGVKLAFMRDPDGNVVELLQG